MLITESRGHFCLSCSDAWPIRMAAAWCVASAALCLIALAGCGGAKGGPATVEVTGTVTLNDTAVEGASVLFSPEIGSSDGRLASQATTDTRGPIQIEHSCGSRKI